MKDSKNEFLVFVAGLMMLVVGLFMFMNIVVVSSTFFGGFSFGNRSINSGVIIIPFIIGIIWMFASYGSLISKIFTAFSALIIVVAVIMSTQLHVKSVSLFEWLLILVLTFGGLGIVLRTLFGDRKPANNTKNIIDKEVKETKVLESKEDPLEELKKNMNK